MSSTRAQKQAGVQGKGSSDALGEVRLQKGFLAGADCENWDKDGPRLHPHHSAQNYLLAGGMG